MKREYVNYIILGAISFVVFIALAQLSQAHHEMLQSVIASTGIIGVLSYISLLVIAIVIAPINTGFLLPIAANSWGPIFAGTYSVFGWTLGAAIAFWLSRRYGVSWVSRFNIVLKLREVEAAIPRENMFIAVVLLRAAFPVEILSYALGVFSTIKFIPYIVSTIIGITPFTFLLAYASVGTLKFQIFVGILSAISFVAGTAYVIHQGMKAHRKIKIQNAGGNSE